MTSINKPGRARGKSDLWFIWPDIHYPIEDKTAMAIASTAHKLLQPEYSIFLGDVMDCGFFSSFDKRSIEDSQVYDFKEKEIDPTNKLIDEVQKNTKKKTYYLMGNHEARIERWVVQSKIGETLYNLVSPQSTIARGRKNFKMTPYTPTIGTMDNYIEIAPVTSRSGGLIAIHGWSHAKHAAHRHIEMARTRSVVFGHVHRQQVFTIRDPFNNTPIKGFSPGTLSQLQPIYAHGGSPTDWIHGFSLVYVGKDSWTEYNVTISNGSCVLPDGREIKV